MEKVGDPDTRNDGQITILLKRLSSGDSSAESELAEIVYARLRSMAKRVVQNGGGPVSLQSTVLANDVLLELARAQSIDWVDREHFFRTAARLLRRRFVDYIRAQNAGKRPPHSARVELDELLLPAADRFEEVLMVDQCLQQLAEYDPKLAELVEMVYFGGVPVQSIAAMRNVTPKTILRHLELARRWLGFRMRPADQLASDTGAGGSNSQNGRSAR